MTEFAWLPPKIAESFCKNALYRVTERTYHAFDTPHLGLDTENFVADVFVEVLRRPIALRGDTEHFQPNMLGKVVLRYLEGMDEPLINGIQAILRATMGGMSVASAEGIATLQSLCQEVGCPYHDELDSTTCCVALVVLWMGLHQEKFPLLATSLQAAARVVSRQRWALILPSSARVSLVTYTAVIAVRYPELDNVQNDLVCFGNYLLGEQATSGGFLPIFWDAPSAYMHAAKLDTRRKTVLDDVKM